mgnify:CR=1 FL=1
MILVLGLALARARQGALDDANTLVLATIGYLSLIAFAIREPQGQPRHATATGRPNVLMIGSDTLRADRIGATRNGKSLTPNIDRLADWAAGSATRMLRRSGRRQLATNASMERWVGMMSAI